MTETTLCLPSLFQDDTLSISEISEKSKQERMADSFTFISIENSIPLLHLMH